MSPPKNNAIIITKNFVKFTFRVTMAYAIWPGEWWTFGTISVKLQSLIISTKPEQVALLGK